MELRDRVALRIRKLRERRGLSQERLAELIDRSVDAVSNLERGKSLPSFETLGRLADKLGVPVGEFFGFEIERDSPRRVALMATLVDVARTLSEDDLEVAVGQMSLLSSRSRERS